MFREFYFKIYELVLSTYHINPIVYIVIYVLATPSYYYGLFIAAKELVVYRAYQKKMGREFTLHDLILRKRFLEGYFLNRISWFAPYFYILIWGRGLPKRVYLLIILWTLVSSWLFLHSLQHKRMSTKEKVS